MYSMTLSYAQALLRGLGMDENSFSYDPEVHFLDPECMNVYPICYSTGGILLLLEWTQNCYLRLSCIFRIQQQINGAKLIFATLPINLTQT